MNAYFDADDFVLTSEDRKHHPARSILKDGQATWGDALKGKPQPTANREAMILKTAHRLEHFAAVLQQPLLVLEGSWDGSCICDALEFVVDGACGPDIEAMLDVLVREIGAFEQLFLAGGVFHYRRC